MGTHRAVRIALGNGGQSIHALLQEGRAGAVEVEGQPRLVGEEVLGHALLILRHGPPDAHRANVGGDQDIPKPSIGSADEILTRLVEVEAVGAIAEEDILAVAIFTLDSLMRRLQHLQFGSRQLAEDRRVFQDAPVWTANIDHDPAELWLKLRVQFERQAGDVLDPQLDSDRLHELEIPLGAQEHLNGCGPHQIGHRAGRRFQMPAGSPGVSSHDH